MRRLRAGGGRAPRTREAGVAVRAHYGALPSMAGRGTGKRREIRLTTSPEARPHSPQRRLRRPRQHSAHRQPARGLPRQDAARIQVQHPPRLRRLDGRRHAADLGGADRRTGILPGKGEVVALFSLSPCGRGWIEPRSGSRRVRGCHRRRRLVTPRPTRTSFAPPSPTRGEGTMEPRQRASRRKSLLNYFPIHLDQNPLLIIIPSFPFARGAS